MQTLIGVQAKASMHSVVLSIKEDAFDEDLALHRLPLVDHFLAEGVRGVQLASDSPHRNWNKEDTVDIGSSALSSSRPSVIDCTDGIRSGRDRIYK